MITLLTRHYNLSNVSGVQFHMQELGLFLQDVYEVDVREYLIPRQSLDRFITTSSKYKKVLPVTQHISKTMITEMNAIYTSIVSREESLFDLVEKLYILASDSMDEMYAQIASFPGGEEKVANILKKATIITDRKVPHTLGTSICPEVFVDRGMYWESWKRNNIVDINNSKKWFHHTRIDHFGGLERKEINLPMDFWYTEKRVDCPEHVYKGLIYNRYHDYMPRLPFEFWNNDKEVYLLDVSDGLTRMLPHIALTAGTAIKINPNDFPRWEMEELVSCLI